MIGSIIEKQWLYDKESFNESLLREPLSFTSALHMGMNFVSDSDASWSTSTSSPPIEELWKSVDALNLDE